MNADWVPGAGMGLLGSAVAWLLSWRVSSAKKDGQTEEREKGLRQDIRDLRDEMKAGVAEMRVVAAMAGKLQASQEVVNRVTAQTLESITDKLDRHESILADHSSTLKLVTELVTRKRQLTE